MICSVPALLLLLLGDHALATAPTLTNMLCTPVDVQPQQTEVWWPILQGPHEYQRHGVIKQPANWGAARAECCNSSRPGTSPAFLKNEGYFTSARNKLSDTSMFPAGAWNESGECIQCASGADGQPVCYMHVWIGLRDYNKEGSSATNILGWTLYHTPPYHYLVQNFLWVDLGCSGNTYLTSTGFMLSGYQGNGGFNEYFSANSSSKGGYCTALQFCPGVENSAAITFMPCNYTTAVMCTEQPTAGPPPGGLWLNSGFTLEE
jgi:hypothetical protein